ncbi:O-antigen ligase family protein [Geodermatophilus sp. SYSU D00691]
MRRPRHGYRRVGLGLLLLAAAAPYRYYGSFPLVASVSVLDAAVAVAAVVLVVRGAMMPAGATGDRRAAGLVSVLPVLCVLSVLWSVDQEATIREVASYAECLVVYAFAVQQTRGLPADRIIRMLRVFLYALLIPPVLMLLHVPGFEPQQPGLTTNVGDYLSYFSRLSHPFTGRSNNLATILLMLCIVLIAWALTHRDVAAYVAALVGTVALVLTFSRGGIVSLLVAGLVAVLLRGPRRGPLRLRPIVVSVVSLAVVATAGWIYFTASPVASEFVGGRLTLTTVEDRQQRYTVGLEFLLQRPFLGYGAGAVPGGNPYLSEGVHNTYLQQLLAYGVVLGLLGVLSLIALAVHFLRRPALVMRRAVGLVLVALLVNFTVESSFEGAALRVVIYLLLGMLVGLSLADGTVPTAERPPARAPAPSPAGRRVP